MSITYGTDAIPDDPNDIKLRIARRLRDQFGYPQAEYNYTGGGVYLVSILIGRTLWEFGDNGGWQWSKSHLPIEGFPEFIEGAALFPGYTDAEEAALTFEKIIIAIVEKMETRKRQQERETSAAWVVHARMASGGYPSSRFANSATFEIDGHRYVATIKAVGF